MALTNETDHVRTMRSHAHEVKIGVPPERVWRAITDPKELVRWFPLEADSDLRVGGRIDYGWGAFEGRCEILQLEPNQHLSITWNMHGELEGEAPLVVDWYLQPEGDGTTLRVVHSGFGPEASFDDEFEGTRRGWRFELNSLRHYLQNHLGQARRVIWITKPTERTPAEVLSQMRGDDGPLGSEDLEDLAQGDRFELECAGAKLEGRVLVAGLPSEFAAELDSMGGALLRFGHEACGGASFAHVWMSAWGSDVEDMDAIENRLREAFEAMDL